MLTGKAPDLRSIVVFGLPCNVYRNPRKSLLQHRSQRGIIVGLSEETKGYNVLLQRESKVAVTQHVKNMSTLSDSQNAQLKRSMDVSDRADEAEEAAPEVEAAMETWADNARAQDGRGTCRNGKKPWSRQAQRNARRIEKSANK